MAHIVSVLLKDEERSRTVIASIAALGELVAIAFAFAASLLR